MITAQEAHKQATNKINCEKELVEIERCIKIAVLLGKLETSTILSNISIIKLSKLIDILEENGYKASYFLYKKNTYYFHVSW